MLQALLDSSAELREPVAKMGAVAAVIGALSDHRDNPQLQRPGSNTWKSSHIEVKYEAKLKSDIRKYKKISNGK